jgi:hypothetical protein
VTELLLRFCSFRKRGEGWVSVKWKSEVEAGGSVAALEGGGGGGCSGGAGFCKRPVPRVPDLD